MSAEQKIVEHLQDAHALESALVQTLTAHVAITPASEYRDLLERHLGETRRHADELRARLGELGDNRNPLEKVKGAAQGALGQVASAAKLPLDLIRGAGSEEKLLANARDEAASEALEIATYDALVALAEAAGDEPTERLAREHRVEEETFLSELRALIGQLARDVLTSDGVEKVTHEAADVARAAASEVHETVTRSDAAPPPVALPIVDYDELTVTLLLPKLRLLTMNELRVVEEYERGAANRKQILDRCAKLRATTDGHLPMRPTL